MNRIYRLIWSKALKCIVAVAETTKGRGKDNTKSQAVGGASTLFQEIQATKQAQAPPFPHKLVNLRNAIPAIAMMAGLMGMHSGEAWADCVRGGLLVTCATPSQSYTVDRDLSRFTVTNLGTVSTIAADHTAINTNGYNIGTSLSNSGTISVSVSISGYDSSGAYGIYNSGSIGTLANSSTIQSSFFSDYSPTAVGIYNSGTISSFINSIGGTIGAITSAASGAPSGKGISNSGLISSLVNSGTISGSSYAIWNEGTISTILNNSGGSISGGASGLAINVAKNGVITKLTNDGSMSGQYGVNLNSSRTYTEASGNIATLTNNGTISTSDTAVRVLGTINTLTNYGLISSSRGSAIHIFNDGFQPPGFNANLDLLINSGVISGSSSGIENGSSIGTIQNNTLASISSVVNYGAGTIGLISNTGTVSTISNTGTISSIANSGTISAITNSGSITTYSGTLPTNYSILINSPSSYGKIGFGSITGSSTMAFGLNSSSTVTANTYTNVLSGLSSLSYLSASSGTFGSYSWALSPEGTVGTLSSIWDLIIASNLTGYTFSGNASTYTNASAISNLYNGRYTVNTITNTGTISGLGTGVYNSGSIGKLVNSGLISGTSYGVFNTSAGSIGTLNNTLTGSIYGGTADIKNLGTISSITNNIGTITLLLNGGSISTITNATIASSAVLSTIKNTGLISSGIFNNDLGSIGSISNSGTINSTNAIAIKNGLTTIATARIGTINNSGAITGLLGIQNVAGTITQLINTGLISGSGIQGGVSNSGTIVTIANTAGTITGTTIGIKNTGTVSTISNTGTISSIANTGTISAITNSGSITAYSGTLPTNYSILINSPSSYGKISFGSITGGSTMAFGLNSSSSVAANTYTNVLSGLSSLSYLSASSGTFGSYSWALSPEGTVGTLSSIWDLVVSSSGGGSTTTTISGGSSESTSSLANSTITSVNLNGGTIVGVSTVGTITQSVTVSASGSAINQNNTYTTIAGVVSGSNRLTITNPSGTLGAVAVTADNSSFSGGFQVNAGAKLQVGNSSALGTGSIDLIGTTSTSATLATTTDMTIANAITVANDPTFDIASGTTLTISSPITDGTISGTIVSGDVVVTGGGTLDLTAVNTYTGTTTITSGSTLALTGNGSIADSSRVYNYGTFDITGSNHSTFVNPVVIKGYTQSSSGTLKMNIAPTTAASQLLQVNGTASIGGTLYVNGTGSSSSYAGNTKYTIINTTGGLTGAFSGATSNLPNATKFSYDAYNAYLSVLAFSTANTQQSLVNTANSLQGTYALQNSILVNSFSYDCNDFGPNGLCISVGGRNTSSSSGNGSTSALLIGSYRATDQLRIGAYFDQNLSASNPGGTVQLANNTPLVGLFGAWAQKNDGTGPEIKISAAYGQKNATITRQVVSNTEPGSGSSTLYSSGAQFSGKYGYAITDRTNIAPYLGIRYAQNNMSSYTEGISSSVQSPLTYQNLNTSATTAIAGIGASHKITPKTIVFGSVGMEQDLKTNYSSYTATGINGLTPIVFNSSPVNTRATGNLGASHELEKNQWISINGAYRQAPYQSLNSTSVMVFYTIGL